ncbi:galanin receptor type 1b isoform X1 [Anabas testudineus]|uniref:Galanin receptor type 1 n=1 Tax=Anabas testudineus TaxID=64144 RepID=A0AAQ6ITJ9_ANATE|nr:galanin receptor type 1b isoform X1 [Anabas testudineus]XP_026233331.1 galanin receptor type 1b isoform X1 [Anabas testudineus]
MTLRGNDSSGWADLPDSNRSELAEGGGSGPEAVVVPAVFGLIFVVGVVGNSLVMVVIGKMRYSVGGGGGGGAGGGGGKRSGSPTNIFILNLSVADLSFLLFCVPFQATIYSLPEWVFGAFLCRFGHYFSTVSMLVSIFTLVAMSVDRYIAVVRSKKSPCVRSRRNALTGVCVIWTLSLVCSVPVAQHQVLTNHPKAPNSTFCWEDWSGASKRTYKVTILVIGYLLPLLLVSCCYIKVLFHLHKKMKNMSKKSERSKRKTAQTVLLVVTAFTICWMPHHIIAMWVEFGTFPLNDASFVFRIVSHCLSYGNSCVNPVLYAFLSENFRKACRQVFTCCSLYPPPPKGKVVRFRMENFSTTHSTTNI